MGVFVLPPLAFLVLSDRLLILERGAKIPGWEGRRREQRRALPLASRRVYFCEILTVQPLQPRGQALAGVNHDSGGGGEEKRRVPDLPCFMRQVKYWTPATEPSFFPSGLSSSTPAHRPPENSVLPQNRRVPTWARTHARAAGKTITTCTGRETNLQLELETTWQESRRAAEKSN